MRKIVSLLLMIILVGCNMKTVNLEQIKDNHKKLNSAFLETSIKIDGEERAKFETTIISRNEVSIHELVADNKMYIKNQKGYNLKNNQWEEVQDVKVDSNHPIYDNLVMNSLFDLINEKDFAVIKEKDQTVIEWYKEEIEDIKVTNLGRTLIFKDKLSEPDKLKNVRIRIEIKDNYIQFIELSGESEGLKISVQTKLKQFNEDFSSKVQLRG